MFSAFSKPQPELNFNPFLIVLQVHEATSPHQHPQHADQLKSAYPREIKAPGHSVLFLTPPLKHEHFPLFCFWHQMQSRSTATSSSVCMLVYKQEFQFGVAGNELITEVDESLRCSELTVYFGAQGGDKPVSLMSATHDDVIQLLKERLQAIQDKATCLVAAQGSYCVTLHAQWRLQSLETPGRLTGSWNNIPSVV